MVNLLYPKNIPNKLEWIEYSKRFYGEPKLIKPKELKNIKQITSVPFIFSPKGAVKCSCPLFFKDDNVYLLIKDYFSSTMKFSKEDYGLPLECLCNKYLNKDKKKKFIYSDCWGSVVLRNEAWILIKNVREQISECEHILEFRECLYDIVDSYYVNTYGFEEYWILGTWEIFLEKVAYELYNNENLLN